MCMFAAVTTARAVDRIPPRCKAALAPRLCAIHKHHHRANLIRGRMGLRLIPYRYMAERHPARRDAILSYWVHVHKRLAARYKAWRRAMRHASAAPWSASWHRAAMCVHSHEGAWNANTGNGFTGGLQFMDSTWLSNGGGRYAPRAYLASPHDQLLVAYHLWRASGWSPWPNTARMCGLL